MKKNLLLFRNHELMSAIESLNEEDIVKMNVPLMIRVFEYINENVKDDVEIHDISERLIQICNENNRHATMDDYDFIVNKQPEKEEDDASTEGLKGDDDHSTVVVVMNDIDQGNALTDALNKFKDKAKVGGDVEMMIKVSDDLESCGIIGHDVNLGNIYHNVPKKDKKDGDDKKD